MQDVSAQIICLQRERFQVDIRKRRNSLIMQGNRRRNRTEDEKEKQPSEPCRERDEDDMVETFRNIHKHMSGFIRKNNHHGLKKLLEALNKGVAQKRLDPELTNNLVREVPLLQLVVSQVREHPKEVLSILAYQQQYDPDTKVLFESIQVDIFHHLVSVFLQSYDWTVLENFLLIQTNNLFDKFLSVIRLIQEDQRIFQHIQNITDRCLFKHISKFIEQSFKNAPRLSEQTKSHCVQCLQKYIIIKDLAGKASVLNAISEVAHHNAFLILNNHKIINALFYMIENYRQQLDVNVYSCLNIITQFSQKNHQIEVLMRFNVLDKLLVMVESKKSKMREKALYLLSNILTSKESSSVTMQVIKHPVFGKMCDNLAQEELAVKEESLICLASVYLQDHPDTFVFMMNHHFFKELVIPLRNSSNYSEFCLNKVIKAFTGIFSNADYFSGMNCRSWHSWVLRESDLEDSLDILFQTQNEKVLRWAYELINQIEESRQTYSDFQEEF